MIHYDEIPDYERVLLHSYFSHVQYFLGLISAVPSCHGFDELRFVKDFIDMQVTISDEVPF